MELGSFSCSVGRKLSERRGISESQRNRLNFTITTLHLTRHQGIIKTTDSHATHLASTPTLHHTIYTYCWSKTFPTGKGFPNSTPFSVGIALALIGMICPPVGIALALIDSADEGDKSGSEPRYCWLHAISTL